MRQITALRNALITLAILSSPGCGKASTLKNECRPLMQTFFQMPLRERMKKFASHEVEDQYRVFICGNQFMHPPAIYLAGPFAQQGAPAATFLKTKLANTKDDLTIRDIVLVFTEMKRRNTYDFSEDQALVTLISDRIGEMKNKDWKSVAQENFSEIIN